MLITKEDLAMLWKFLTVEAKKGSCSTMIFVANNCDALCSSKILTDLLKQSTIQYTWVPVFSYSDIENCLKEDAMSEDIKSLVFLNCGAKLDFTQYWFNQRETDIKTFIFDSQRPVSHNNVLSQKAVYVVDFGDINVEECPEDEDLDVMEQEMEGEGDDDVVDGEKEYEKIINGGKDKSEHNEDHKQSQNEGEGNDEDEFDTDLIGKKRKRDIETDLDAKNDKKKRLMRVANYYSGSYYSKCCSYLVYQLGVQLNKQSVDSFWLWILGLTDQLVHSKISSIQYDEEYSQCHKDFISITGKNFDQENSTDASNQNEATNDKAFDKKGMFYSNVDLSSENIKVGSILPSQEFRFMFLRSWTLYKSVFYSNYVVSKLKLWEDMGKRELNRFFAMLGIPAEEYNQQYKFMNQKFKDVLKDKIPAIAKQFDLDHILFSSFVRQIDHKTQLNASDMVYAITSLLESPKSVMVDNIPQLDEVAKPSTAEEEEKQFSLNQQDYRDRQIENFWAAYNALDIKNKAYIDWGIALSKELQIALMGQGASLITNKKVMPCTRFRYAIINNDSIAQAKIFQYPMAIQKLALFIMEAYKETRSTKEERSMVLWVKNSERDSYLVVGVLPRDSTYMRNKNEFGQHFQDTAEKIGASFKYDGFETSLIEINEDGFEEFIDELVQV